MADAIADRLGGEPGTRVVLGDQNLAARTAGDSLLGSEADARTGEDVERP